jgi:hypothetical protein
MQRIAQGLYTVVLVVTPFVLFLSGCAKEEPLPPVSLPESLPPSMKEYELYSWKPGRAWRFTLITGTNRLKTLAEITSPESVIEDDWVKVTVEGVPDLESVLERLPSDAHVSWRGASHPGVDSSTSEVALQIPSERLVKEIQTCCAEAGVRLEIIR